MSLDPESVDEDGRPLKGRCAIANQSRRAKIFVKRLASGNAKELNNIILELFAEMYLRIIDNGTFEELSKLLKTAIKVKKQLFPGS